MKISNRFTVEIMFILISSLGGILLVLCGLTIGWIIGPLIMAAILAFKQPNWFKNPANPNKGISPHWVRIGQTILAVQLGQKINISVLATFQDHWMTITLMLLLSVLFSLLSGLVIWKFSQTDMITSFFATAPGGIVTMPSLADDAGANTGVVSIVQTMRVFLVVMIIPLIAATWIAPGVSDSVTNVSSSTSATPFELSHLVGTILLLLAAWGGKFIGKKLKFPSPDSNWWNAFCSRRTKFILLHCWDRIINLVASYHSYYCSSLYGFKYWIPISTEYVSGDWKSHFSRIY